MNNHKGEICPSKTFSIISRSEGVIHKIISSASGGELVESFRLVHDVTPWTGDEVTFATLWPFTTSYKLDLVILLVLGQREKYRDFIMKIVT